MIPFIRGPHVTKEFDHDSSWSDDIMNFLLEEKE